MNKIVIASLSAVLVTTIAVAYEIHHPNLRDAYGATENAIHHVQEAQANNKGLEFGGHAEKPSTRYGMPSRNLPKATNGTMRTIGNPSISMRR